MSDGIIVGGKYRLDALLGRGGMGAVWRAHDLDLNAPVAVKLLDFAIAASGEGLARFHREAEAAAALRSPHVVQILGRGVDEASGQPYIAMELMEGRSLASCLEQEGALSPATTARILTHVARALIRAHDAGIVHRDLKPDNIFLVKNDDEEIAKVLDFGIAKSDRHGLGVGSYTRTGAVMGTPYYMSPEQISGAKSVDFRTDLWAFGVIACECATGRRPFDADTYGGLTLKICAEPIPKPSSLGQVPPGFDEWFARAVARDPQARFASAREASEELRRICSGVAAPPVSVDSFRHPGTLSATSTSAMSTSALIRSTHEEPEPPRRSSAGKWAIGGVALAALGGGALWLAQARSAPPEPPVEAGNLKPVSTGGATPASTGLPTITAPQVPPPPSLTVATAASVVAEQARPPLSRGTPLREKAPQKPPAVAIAPAAAAPTSPAAAPTSPAAATPTREPPSKPADPKTSTPGSHPTPLGTAITDRK